MGVQALTPPPLAHLFARPAVHLLVPGEPVPWQRPRRNGSSYFTAPAVVAHERLIRQCWLANGQPRVGFTALAVTATFVLSRPKAHFGTGRNAGTLKESAPEHPTGKPDLDNLLKILDALNGKAWVDDAQIVSFSHVRKRYADPGEAPFSAFTIWAA